MNDTASTGLAHCSLMILLATGVAIFALMDDRSDPVARGGSLGHLSVTAID
ncbi:hypothetical protein PhaeoP83_01258 [Phaeobacter inhibens]|uniref:Uncharacterized protein n=1 Tax=Phaeobacter inhibens TaxID=221822 RepID=A0A2I7HAY2_9RHOB|nr:MULTISPECIES: hypothetical protein [Phaeobacter]AUQ46406.1 hypothetical protein PhaeoP10_02075 [Phaeobacter inhibens]AUQ49549.1 hypothetical protein PhaeoP83_01258 [Phaeobacter inhibens]AUQ54693.1 hypothetical protein PhaeoP92_02026 [Phaeobacter inhibens]AUQ58928.1 hypothetical protein PhaeoP30_02025 [Phaeobacter inhibens]AUQ63009.1 hypothetical protein PhaeoP51_02035 [Phaeobacter inhibens]